MGEIFMHPAVKSLCSRADKVAMRKIIQGRVQLKEENLQTLNIFKKNENKNYRGSDICSLFADSTEARTIDEFIPIGEYPRRLLALDEDCKAQKKNQVTHRDSNDSASFDSDDIHLRPVQPHLHFKAMIRADKQPRFMPNLCLEAEYRRDELNAVLQRNEIRKRKCEELHYGITKRFVTQAYSKKLNEDLIWKSEKQDQDEQKKNS